MAQFTFTPLVPNSPENVNTLNNILTQAQTAINSIDETQLTNSMLQKLGLVNGSQIGRGATITATSQNTASTTYTTLSTADQVANLVLPANGLIYIVYRALWRVNGGTGSAAIFIGSNQLKTNTPGGGAPTTTLAETSTSVGFDSYLHTVGTGLSSNSGLVASNDTLVTTGQTISDGASTGTTSMCLVEAAAGTYTVSVQFKNNLGGANQTQLNNRALWVKAEAFA